TPVHQRRCRHRAADLPARHASVPLLRRLAAGGGPGRRRSARRRVRAAARTAGAEVLLLPALRAQSDGAHDPPRRRGGAAGGGGATPGAGRRGRLRRQSLLWRAAAGAAEGPRPRRRGGLHRDVLEGAVPRAAPRLARGAAAAGRAPPRRQAARGPAHERGVAYTPGAAFWVDDSGERTLRLSFSSVPGGKIDEGVRRLGEVVRAARRRPAHPVERVAAPTV